MYHVTPCAGVWIEINVVMLCHCQTIVTPCAGVWIEISPLTNKDSSNGGHSLCGSVD